MSEAQKMPGPGDEALIMCMRPEHLLGEPVGGATLEPCHRCGRDMWVSPSSIILTRQVKEAGATMEWVCCCCTGAHSGPALAAKIQKEGGVYHLLHQWDEDGKCKLCPVEREPWEREITANLPEGVTLDMFIEHLTNLEIPRS